MSHKSFKLIVSYDGGAYYGWQVQKSGPTIQSKIEAALQSVTGESIRAIASGRTDSGVHALGQVVSFRSQTKLEPRVLQRALNANLPLDIRVRSLDYAPDGFHAIHDAVSKRYRYYIQDGGVSDPFWRRSCHYTPYRLDEQAMQLAATRLLGEHDFSTYEKLGSPRATSVRTIHEFTVRRRSTEFFALIVIEVSANGFLYNMVRNLVGTLIEVGRGLQSVDWPFEILAERDRKVAGQTAPAHGLFLVDVQYIESDKDA